MEVSARADAIAKQEEKGCVYAGFETVAYNSGCSVFRQSSAGIIYELTCMVAGKECVGRCARPAYRKLTKSGWIRRCGCHPDRSPRTCANSGCCLAGGSICTANTNLACSAKGGPPHSRPGDRNTAKAYRGVGTHGRHCNKVGGALPRPLPKQRYFHPPP